MNVFSPQKIIFFGSCATGDKVPGVFLTGPNVTKIRLNNNKTQLAVGSWQKTAPDGAKRF
jgi:hypothetical protein